MMKRVSWMSAALAALGMTGYSSLAMASSHSEAPGTASDSEIDNTDTWAFVNNGNLVVVAAYNGLWDHAAPNYKKFADNGAKYTIHIARGGTDLDADLEYTFEFKSPTYADKGKNPKMGELPYQDPGDLALGPLNFGGKEFFSQLSGSGAWAQTYTVTKKEGNNSKVILSGVAVAPPNVGPRTNDALNFVLNQPAGTSYEGTWVDGANLAVHDIPGGDGGGKVFAGPRRDGFYVDLGAVFDLAGLPDVGSVPELGAAGNFGPDNPFNPAATTGTRTHATARNSTDHRNVMAITLSIPVPFANGKATTPGAGIDDLVGVWASASRQKVTILRKNGEKETHGPYVQVSRLGLPLINEAVIGLQDKDRWNSKSPKDDVSLFGAYFLNPVIVRDAQGVGLYGAGGVLNAIGCGTDGANGVVAGTGIADLRTGRTDILTTINLGYMGITATGDVLRVDLSNPNDLLGNANFSIPTSIAAQRVCPSGGGCAISENRGAFPNGRTLAVTQEADVTDIEVTLLLCGLNFITANGLTGTVGGGAINGGIVGDRVSFMAHQNRTTFPYLSEPVPQSDVRASVSPGN